jgi:hypothetical protein
MKVPEPQPITDIFNLFLVFIIYLLLKTLYHKGIVSLFSTFAEKLFLKFSKSFLSKFHPIHHKFSKICFLSLLLNKVTTFFCEVR